MSFRRLDSLKTHDIALKSAALVVAGLALAGCNTNQSTDTVPTPAPTLSATANTLPTPTTSASTLESPVWTVSETSASTLPTTLTSPEATPIYTPTPSSEQTTSSEFSALPTNYEEAKATIFKTYDTYYQSIGWDIIENHKPEWFVQNHVGIPEITAGLDYDTQMIEYINSLPPIEKEQVKILPFLTANKIILETILSDSQITSQLATTKYLVNKKELTDRTDSDPTGYFSSLFISGSLDPELYSPDDVMEGDIVLDSINTIQLGVVRLFPADVPELSRVLTGLANEESAVLSGLLKDSPSYKYFLDTNTDMKFYLQTTPTS